MPDYYISEMRQKKSSQSFERSFAVNGVRFWRLLLMTLYCFAPPPAAAKTKVILANGDISSWRYHVFNNILPTRYKTEEDEKIGSVLTASGVGGASGYVLETELDLDKTPWLHFRWRVDTAADGFDEKIRGGDDFAFRIYLAGRIGLRYYSVSLVRSQQSAGETWKSPYSGFLNKTYIYVFAGGDSPLGEWQTTTINIAKLWRKLFNNKTNIELVGLMTDGDDTGSIMKAKYGEIILSDSPASPF